MARPKSTSNKTTTATSKSEFSNSNNVAESDDFSAELIKQLNKEHNSNIAFNLGAEEAPTTIKRWLSTGSRQLDSIIANKTFGGFPEGRIVEISGPSSSGKSHLVYEAIKSCQAQGGIAVYIDTENATSLENIQSIGIDVSKRFVFVQTGCTEEVFSIAESTIIKSRGMNKDVPVLIVWDSVAGSSPKAELEGDYDQNTIGLQARVIGKGMRKIVNIIGNHNCTFLIVNQQRKAIGVSFGDDTITPGGMGLPYACSTRIRITSTGQNVLKNKNGDVYGVVVKAKTIKNKVARPFRSVEFEIHFGRGVREHEQVFDLFREYCGKTKMGVPFNGKLLNVEGTGAWKTFTVSDASTGEVEIEVKCYKPDFGSKVLYVPEYQDYMNALFEAALVVKPDEEIKNHNTFDSGAANDSENKE